MSSGTGYIPRLYSKATTSMQPSRIANETNPFTLTRSTLDFTIWCPRMAVRPCWAGPGSPPFQVPRAAWALARAEHVDGARPTP